MAGKINVGEVFVSIAPDIRNFGAQASRSLAPILTNLSKSASINITANTEGLDKAVGVAQDTLKKGLEIGGLALGGHEIFDFLKESVDASRTAERATRQVNAAFGDHAEAVRAWAEQAHQSIGQSTGDAEVLAGKTADILRGYGVDTQQIATQTTGVVQRMADIASHWGSDITTVQDAFDSALAGRTRGLKNYGIVIDDTRIKDEAARLGLTHKTVDTQKVAAAQDRLAKAQRDYAAAQKAAKDPRSIAEAEQAVALAYSEQQRALVKQGAGSAAYLQKTLALEDARDRLTAAEERQGDAASSLKEKQDAITAAQGELNDALQGTTDDLTDAQKAQAVLSLFMQDSTKWAGSFGQTSEDKAEQAAAAWENAKERIGDALRPIITEEETRFGTWVQEHQGDIERFAQGLAGALQKGADFVQVLADHKEAVAAIAAAFVTIHEVGSQSSFLNNARRTIETILGVGGGKGGAVEPTITGPVARQIAQATINVAEGVINAPALRGVGGPLPPGEEPLPPGTILGPDGKPVSKGSGAKGAAAGGEAAAAAEGEVGAAGAGAVAGKTPARGAAVASNVFIVGMAGTIGDQLAKSITGSIGGTEYGFGDLLGVGGHGFDLWTHASDRIGDTLFGGRHAYGATAGDQLLHDMENAGDKYQNAVNLASSKGFADVVFGRDSKSLEQFALFAKSQAAEAQGKGDESARQHWEHLAETYDTLNQLVQQGSIRTQDDLNYFLSHANDLTQEVVHFQELLVDEVRQAAAEAQAWVESGAFAHAESLRKTQLDTSPNAPILGLGTGGAKGVISQASGGREDYPRLAVVGDAPRGPEWVLRQDQVMQTLVAAAAQAVAAQGKGAPAIGHVSIVRPTSDVDPITSLNRWAWHQTYDDNGVRPSSAAYPADLWLREG